MLYIKKKPKNKENITVNKLDFLDTFDDIIFKI